MEALGYKYKIVSSTQIGKFYDIEKRDYYYLANGIYSKIELEEEEIYGFKYLNRNIIKATITYNNQRIQIFNTHLEYFETPNKFLTDQGIKENHLIQQYNDLAGLLEFHKNINPNIIVCGDYNLNLYNKNEGFRYRMWAEKTKYIRDNFNNVNRSQIKTNFSQDDQTDFIFYNKNANIKTIYSFTIFTNISDHYLLFADFI
jgi:endonuclease/exonuclease/phosphatase family metal-dependent hydrolase